MFKMIFETDSEEFRNTWNNKSAIYSLLRDVADEIFFDQKIAGVICDKSGKKIGAYSIHKDWK